METVKELQSQIDVLEDKITIIENDIYKKNEDVFNSECKKLLDSELSSIKSSVKGVDNISVGNTNIGHTHLIANVKSPIGFLIPHSFLYNGSMLYEIYFEETEDFQDEVDY